MDLFPINPADVISGSIESVRLEFKGGWSEQTLEQVVRTICAFANDYLNLNGGYIVIGVNEKDGQAELPPVGVPPERIDEIQRAITGRCRQITPSYQPAILPVSYQGRRVIVIYAPGGDNRPYQSPASRDRFAYYVRLGSETIEAKGALLTSLMQMTAKTPFDDRRNPSASIDAISPALVRNFLSDVGSDLASSDVRVSDRDLYQRLRLSIKVNAHEVPRNVALLFFANDPELYFPGARIEVAQFGDDLPGNLVEERVFRGPLHIQIRQALDYLNAFSSTMIQKMPNEAASSRSVAFPYEAMREAIVNAVYHRSYEGVQEPTKVYLFPTRMEIISYPGPVPGIQLRHFETGSIPPVPNRNRRIGEFLKELRLAEGRGTGIPKIQRKMRENGSPAPIFEFDEETRSYFKVTLPAHPQYVVIHALREAARLWAIGEKQSAVARLETALQAVRSSALVTQQMEYLSDMGDLNAARQVFRRYEQDHEITDKRPIFAAMARILLEHGNEKEALAILDRVQPPPPMSDENEIIEWALLFKRSGRLQQAHQVFASSYDRLKDNPKALHEFAQTKMGLTRQTRHTATRRQLNLEAAELLRRAIQISTDPARTAWCWFDLARALTWLRAPEAEIAQAYERAISLLPEESRFVSARAQWQNRRSAGGMN